MDNPLLKKTNLIPAASNTICIFCNQEMNTVENKFNHQKEVHNFNRVTPIITKRLLIQFPTRGRRDKFFNTLDIYYLHIDNINNVVFNIVIDSDDEQMCNEETIQKLQTYKNLVISKSCHKSKVEAFNDLNNINLNDFDIIALASDDMIPQIKGYDKVIIDNMNKYYPDNFGVLWFWDGYRKDLNTNPILGVPYYKLFNYILNPNYKSFFCDNEFMEVASFLNKQTYVDECILRHDHSLWLGQEEDSLGKANNAFWIEDERTYVERKNNSFYIKNFDIMLEILITTLDGRENSLLYLTKKLSNQIDALHLRDKIKISFLKDNRQMSTGKKRNTLIENAVGKYVVFVDDDDDISDNYVKLVFEAVLKDPDVVGTVLIWFYQERAQFSIASIENKMYSESGPIFYRIPSHTNPMKRELIKDIKYPDKCVGEDTEYAIDLFHKKTLKTEEFIEQPIYYYKDSI